MSERGEGYLRAFRNVRWSLNVMLSADVLSERFMLLLVL